MHRSDSPAWMATTLDAIAAEVAHGRALVQDACARLAPILVELAAAAPETHGAHDLVGALQFEDLVSQLLAGAVDKLEALRELSSLTAADPSDPRADTLRAHIQHRVDHQVVDADRAAGDIELF